MKIWLATTNRGKILEVEAMVEKHGLVLQTPQNLKVYSPPEENGKTFIENARLKARSLKSVVGASWVMGEDSGLEVEALGNLPGIHSARYAGPKASDGENVAKLLKMMQIRQVQTRKASFKTALVVLSPSGVEHVFEGEMKGEIAKAPRGNHGFGYDPVFIPEGYDKTTAELEPMIKNSLSHRAQAVHRMLDSLRTLFAQEPSQA
jgi:XTP/dITP diphosphohydrolase